MKELPVVFSDPARQDLEAILSYLFEQSGNIRTALAYVRRIEDRCDRIGHVPRGGTARDAVIKGLRFVNFEGRAIITYVIENDAVLITNIFYGGRDYAALIGRR